MFYSPDVFGAQVQFMILSLDVILWCIREVIALREKLPQKSVAVLVGPALPWMVRSRKVEHHTLQSFAELSMFREFLSAIWRDRKMRLPRECLTHHLVPHQLCSIR